MIKRLALSFFALFFASMVSAQTDNKFVREGNCAYKRGSFTNAETSYRRALGENKQSFEANFNLGNALYKQKKYKEAVTQFKKTEKLGGTDSKRLAFAYHNVGNSYFQQQDYEKSIEAYKNSLRFNPSDNQTRYNLALAQSKLKKNKNKQQNKQNKQQNQNNKQNQQQKQDSKMSDDNAKQILNASMQDERDVQNRVKSNQPRNASRQVEKDW